MKRIPAFLLVTVMMLSVAAAAGADPDLSDMIIANGTLQAAEHVDITAPFSGTLKPFSVETGDVVHVNCSVFLPRACMLRKTGRSRPCLHSRGCMPRL